MYGHMSTSDLTLLRDKLQTSLTARLKDPTSAESNGRRVDYRQQIADIRRELNLVCLELQKRDGCTSGPIYLVG